jgi:hypothetical protein
LNTNNDKKRVFTSLGIILVVVLLIYKLPNRSYSIIEYIIKPIKIKGNTYIISGFIPLILIVLATNILSKIEKIKGRNTSIIFIAILVIVMPVMNWGIDIMRTGYHSIKNEGVSGVEIMDTVTSLSIEDNRVIINANIKLKNYNIRGKSLRVRIYFPEELAQMINKTYYESERVHKTYGNRKIRDVQEIISIELKNGKVRNELLNYWKSDVKLEYELY